MLATFRTDVGQASLSILTSHTREKIASMLDSRKILLSDSGYHRDWKGIAEQAQLVVAALRTTKISPSQHSIHLWAQRGGLLNDFWAALEKMDRYDVIDDTLQDIYNDYDRTPSTNLLPRIVLPQTVIDGPISLEEMDLNVITYDDQLCIKEGRDLQRYDALVLYTDEDIDFVNQMVNKLEGEYKLKLCLIHRDLVGGLQYEYAAVMRLMRERCLRVLVVLSEEFLCSPINDLLIKFATAIGVEQSKRLMVPCREKPCNKPDVIIGISTLDYFRFQIHPTWNYWEKLADSIKPDHIRLSSSPQPLTTSNDVKLPGAPKNVIDQEVPQKIDNAESRAKSLNFETNAPRNIPDSNSSRLYKTESSTCDSTASLIHKLPSPPQESPSLSKFLGINVVRTKVRKAYSALKKHKYPPLNT